MAVFSYKAVDPSRRTVKGTISGDSPRHARDLLRGQGLRVQELIAKSSANSSRSRLRVLPGSYRANLTTFVSELSTLLAVGVPITEALDTLVKQQRGGFKTCLMLVRDKVASGASLAEAMSDQPQIFDHFTLTMVQVGENSGTLDDTLARLASFKSKLQELKNKVATALLYPLIVLAVSLCVTVFLMTYVVPMLLENLLDADKALPWPTAVLKSISELLTDHGLLVLLLGSAVCLLGIVWIKTDTGRRIWHGLILKVPVIGVMCLKQEISRCALVIATLSRSGIPFLSALESASNATRNEVIRQSLSIAAIRIKSGIDIGESLAHDSVIPQSVVHIFAVGQDSGQLEPMLERLSQDYDQQVNTASARLSAALEPLLIVVLSVFVGFILFATMLPILEAGNVL